MSVHVDKVLDIILDFINTHAVPFLAHPPRTSEELGRFILPIIERSPDFNDYLHRYLDDHGGTRVAAELSRGEQSEFAHVYFTLIRMRDELFFDTLCDHYHAFMAQVDMDFEHPCSGFMLIYLAAAHLSLVIDSIDSAVAKTAPAAAHHVRRATRARTQTPFALASMSDPAFSAEQRDYVRHACLVAWPTRPMRAYTVRELMSAMYLVAERWSFLDPCDELLDHLLELAHRGFMIMTEAKTEAVHDVPKMREDRGKLPVRGGEDVAVYGGNWNLLRRLSGGLVRMIAMTRWRIGRGGRSWGAQMVPVDVFCAGERREQMIANVRAALVDKIEKLESMPTLRAEMRDLYNSSGQTFGDMEKFVEECNGDLPKPRDVIFSAKPHQVQQAWMGLNQAVIMSALCRIREDEPFYHDLYTSAHRLYAQNVKLYAAETFTKQKHVRLIADFSVSEQDVIENMRRIIDRGAPVIVQSFGRLHVMDGPRFYECMCAEHAILTWCMVIMDTYGGKLPGDNDMSDVITQILNEAPVYAETDAWRDVKVIEGVLRE